METLTCIALARELNSTLRDMYVQEVEMADAGETLLIQMKGKPGGDKRPGWMVLAACGGRAFTFFSHTKPEISGRAWPAPLSEFLERRLVRSVSHSGMDRRIKITFGASKETGGRREMFVELFAKKPRAYLVDPETSGVVGSFGVRGENKSGPYVPSPPPADKLNPMEMEAGDLEKSLPPGVTGADLVRKLFGVGNLLAREAITLGGSLGPAGALKRLLSEALDGAAKGYVVGPSAELGLETPEALVFSPTVEAPPPVEECRTINDAVEKSFLACARLSKEIEFRNRASKEIRADLKRLVRTRKALDDEMREAEHAVEYRRMGELILSQIKKVSRGLSEIELPDLEAEGLRRRIALEPRLSPADNAAAYFKKARKLQKKLKFLPGRIAELAKRENSLRDKLEDVASGRARPSAKASRSEPERRASKKDKWPTGVSPRRFTSSDGWIMYVGRDNKENDYITFAFAKPDDLWFHAHGVPGSHVVLRREGRKANPSKRCIEETAAAAAYFSKGRTSHTVSVIYTEKRYVRKPRKGKAGTALFSNEQTVMVAPRLPQEED